MIIFGRFPSVFLACLSGAYYGFLSVCKLYWCRNHYSLVTALIWKSPEWWYHTYKERIPLFHSSLSVERNRQKIYYGDIWVAVNCDWWNFVPCKLPVWSARGQTGGNFSTGGVWESPDVSLCKYKSERTNKLKNIAKVGHFFNIYLLLL